MIQAGSNMRRRNRGVAGLLGEVGKRNVPSDPYKQPPNLHKFSFVCWERPSPWQHLTKLLEVRSGGLSTGAKRRGGELDGKQSGLAHSDTHLPRTHTDTSHTDSIICAHTHPTHRHFTCTPHHAHIPHMHHAHP